jgi:hypothetical protein
MRESQLPYVSQALHEPMMQRLSQQTRTDVDETMHGVVYE